jgi:hypothetical protein
MRVCQFQSMLSLNRVEPGDHIVSVWTRQGENSPRTSLGELLRNRLLTNDVVVCVFKSELNDLPGTRSTSDNEIKSDCAGSLLLGCGGTLATRRVAIL